MAKPQMIALVIDPENRRRIVALSGGDRKMSEFLRRVLFLGIEREYGPSWEEIADDLVDIEDRADSERRKRLMSESSVAA